jgi:hypothetical protein
MQGGARCAGYPPKVGRRRTEAVRRSPSAAQGAAATHGQARQRPTRSRMGGEEGCWAFFSSLLEIRSTERHCEGSSAERSSTGSAPLPTMWAARSTNNVAAEPTHPWLAPREHPASPQEFSGCSPAGSLVYRLQLMRSGRQAREAALPARRSPGIREEEVTWILESGSGASSRRS